MMRQAPNKSVLFGSLVSLGLLIALAGWIMGVDLSSGWKQAGWLNFSLGFVLLSAYLLAKVLKGARLPLISGYIFAGILAGPYVADFLNEEMVSRLGLVNDLALSFIALVAGATLDLRAFRGRGHLVAANLFLNIVVVFGGVCLFVMLSGRWFGFTRQLSAMELSALAVLLGTIAVARSPSSAIAIIGECRAEGPFTDMVLGVTILIDVLIIILFSMALSISRVMLSTAAGADFGVLGVLGVEMLASLALGAAMGLAISFYIKRAGHDLALLLLTFGVAVTKISLWLGHLMEARFDLALQLEPLLICISAGFTVRRFSQVGHDFLESLERSALPIYVLFFTLAGVSLNFEALGRCWMFTICLVLVRAIGLYGASWAGQAIPGNTAARNGSAWMAYLTQAGVSIGLAQIAQREAPEIGVYLTTVVLAVIAVNQVVGPIMFKAALNRVGEAHTDPS
jgi:Kef-type K+ transport system membrane component KefB